MRAMNVVLLFSTLLYFDSMSVRMTEVKMAKPKKKRFSTLTFLGYILKKTNSPLCELLVDFQEFRVESTETELLAICNSYSNEHKVVDFQKWILQLLFCVPDYK
jgi:hypothetical protein